MKKATTAVSAILAALLASTDAHADVAISDVTARQRYPWNGLVDITCAVSGIEGETNGLKLAVGSVMPDTGRARNIKHVQMEKHGAWSDDREVTTNGAYRLLWDAAADLGPVRYTNMVVRVSFDAHEKVQLWEGGPYWATTNIGAEEPWEYGYYFWWGDTVGYYREGDAWVASDGSSQNFWFDSGTTPTYNKSVATLRSEGWIVTRDGTDVLAPEHDAAQVQWGGDWRMPTHQELYDLCYNKCDWTWVSQNGVNGYVVRGRSAFASNSIFIPAAGYGGGSSLFDASSNGLYWSSVVKLGNASAYDLGFNSSDHNTNHSSYNMRGYGARSIRPVQGFTK